MPCGWNAFIDWRRQLRRFVVFGSFVTTKSEPQLTGESRSEGGVTMIANDQELKVTLERLAQFQAQLAIRSKVETNPANYHAAASGFIAEIDRKLATFILESPSDGDCLYRFGSCRPPTFDIFWS
jgi:hypothetical protein